MENFLTFENVSKSFYSLKEETKVLQNISFNVKKGEIVALVGPSGCGKTTLLNLICGLTTPDEGNIVRKGTIGYMFQKDQLFDWRTVYKNITIGPEIAKKGIDKKKIETMLEKYELYEFKDYYPKQLSGGMRQRVALLRTLALNPDILLLDEPFSSLDYQTKIKVQEDMYKIIQNENKTAILVTHDISEAIAMADKVIVLTKRPTTIKGIHEIHLDIEGKKTPLKARNSSRFKEYFNLLWKELDFDE